MAYFFSSLHMLNGLAGAYNANDDIRWYRFSHLKTRDTFCTNYIIRVPRFLDLFWLNANQ